MFKKLLLICLLVVTSFSFDEIYFLPKDSDVAKNKIAIVVTHDKSIMNIGDLTISLPEH